MMKFVMLTIFFTFTTVVKAQTVEPPTGSDEFGWLRWAVIILLGIVLTGSGTFFAFIKGSYESRLKDKDAEIERMVTRMTEQKNTTDQLRADKDVLHRDMQEKVIPALTSASDLIRTFLNSTKK